MFAASSQPPIAATMEVPKPQENTNNAFGGFGASQVPAQAPKAEAASDVFGQMPA